ncbi:ReoY family proteolytic degradation factor [Anaerobacillus sp. MEB173]|uniref:ReoY family proteolytic degradation factor n=1 Tax=Anaerobacillus sp. MEB173 TaxID=3383345 RepID=UPI003F900003
MSFIISVVEKKDFLNWFLNKHQLKRRECAWLLNYLLSDDALMEKVHFVEHAEYCPKGLIISANDVDSIPFTYHKEQHVTMDAEKCFHDIRLNSDEDVYIQLNFSGAKTNPQYAAVLEENPFLPVNDESNQVNSVLAEIILDKVMMDFQRRQLLEAIDEALERNDRERFIELSNQLNQLK